MESNSIPVSPLWMTLNTHYYYPLFNTHVQPLPYKFFPEGPIHLNFFLYLLHLLVPKVYIPPSLKFLLMCYLCLCNWSLLFLYSKSSIPISLSFLYLVPPEWSGIKFREYQLIYPSVNPSKIHSLQY